MDNRNKIIENTILSMQNVLTENQLSELKNTLYIQLNEYDLTKRCTEVAMIDNSCEATLRRYIVTKRIEGKSEGTLKRYYDINRDMLVFLQKPLDKITTFDLRYYLAYYKENHKVINSTLDGMRRVYKSFFSWCFAEEIISHNPSASLTQIKSEKVIRKPYSDTDMELVKRQCKNKRDRAIVEFLYSSGCRISEVIALNRDDINFVTREAIVRGKGNKQRIIYLSEICALYLREYLDTRTDDNPCLFAYERKPYGRFKQNGIRAMLKRTARQAHVDNVHPHRYRRTLATNLIDCGASIQDVATILGHEDIKTTQIYCHISQQNVRHTHQKYIG